MTVRNILKLPEDETFLRTVMPPVEVFGKYTRKVKRDMIDTMMYWPYCAGMSSIQIGEPTRCIVISPETKTCIFNPVITAESIEHKIRTEGCFSLEDWWDCDRPVSCTFEGFDENGEPVKFSSGEFFEDWYRFGQHELDHINGRLISDFGILNLLYSRRDRSASRYLVKAN